MMYNRFVELRFVNSGIKIGGANLFKGGSIERPLHIDVKCNMKSEAAPNDAEITIWNLSFQTSDKILVAGEQIEVWAGYKPQGRPEFIGMIFKGQIRSALTNNEAVNRKTVIHIGDGDNAYKNAKVKKKVAKGSFKGQVDAAYEAMSERGIERGSIDFDEQEVGRTLTFNGESAREILNDVCASSGAIWMIIDGKLHIHKRENYLTDSRYILTPENGLLGSPVFTDEGVNIKTLMIPDLRPGMRIGVKSNKAGGPRINGAYKIDSIGFSASNSNGEHACSIKLMELDAKGKVKGKKK